MFSVDALWLLGEDLAAEELATHCETIPEELDQYDSVLPKAVIVAFSAKKLLM